MLIKFFAFNNFFLKKNLKRLLFQKPFIIFFTLWNLFPVLLHPQILLITQKHKNIQPSS